MEGYKSLSLFETALQGIAVSECDKNSCTKCEYPRKSTSDSSANFERVYPSATELTTINNSVECTESNCKEIFTSQSNLNLHLYKTHNKREAIVSISHIKHFYCPIIQCIYHESEWFKNKKLLKQHYLKVHSPKTYICETCNEGFSSKAYKNMHVDYCGVIFKCNECPLSYRRYESLLTHARRKNHVINEKASFKLVKQYNKSDLSTSKNGGNSSNKLKILLPNLSSSMPLLIVAKNSKMCDHSTQTEPIIPKLDIKLSRFSRYPVDMTKNIRKTHINSIRDRSSSETQTVGNYIKKKQENCDMKKWKDNLKLQSSTQTYNVPSKSVSSITIIDANDDELLNSSDNKRTSSGTQTMIQSDSELRYSSLANVHSHDSVNAESTDSIVNNLFEKIFQNCNMETQTDSIFGDDLFNDCDYYSNMYTQTCEDMLLNDLELNNIETQTVDEMLRSVESQTTMSQTKRSQVICRGLNHMETQTDMEFKHILEVINA